MKFDPSDSNLLLSGGWDKSVMIWDVRTNKPVRRIEGPSVCGDAIDLNCGTVVTGSYRDTDSIQLWNQETGSSLGSVDWNKGSLNSSNPCLMYGLQFDKVNGEYLIAAGAGSNEVKVFENVLEFKPRAVV